MGENKSGPEEGIKGTVEGVKGKLKEAAGSVVGRDDMVREGQAQQDKADAERDAAKREAQAESARSGPRPPRSGSSRTSEPERPGLPPFTVGRPGRFLCENYCARAVSLRPVFCIAKGTSTQNVQKPARPMPPATQPATWPATVPKINSVTPVSAIPSRSRP